MKNLVPRYLIICPRLRGIGVAIAPLYRTRRYEAPPLTIRAIMSEINSFFARIGSWVSRFQRLIPAKAQEHFNRRAKERHHLLSTQPPLHDVVTTFQRPNDEKCKIATLQITGISTRN